MSFNDLASLLDAATSRFTTLMSDIHAEGRTARVVLTGGTAGIALLERLAGEDIDWSRVEVFFGDERNVDVELTSSGRALREQALSIPGAVVDALGVELADLEELHAVLTRVNTAAVAAARVPSA